MSLIDKELKELSELKKGITDGTVNPESAELQIAIFSQREKLMSLELKAIALIAKYGEIITSRIDKTSMLSPGIVDSLPNTKEAEINPLPDVEEVEIECPSIGKMMRSDCLDHFEDSSFDTCEKCQLGKEVRKIVCVEN